MGTCASVPKAMRNEDRSTSKQNVLKRKLTRQISKRWTFRQVPTKIEVTTPEVSRESTAGPKMTTPEVSNEQIGLEEVTIVETPNEMAALHDMPQETTLTVVVTEGPKEEGDDVKEAEKEKVEEEEKEDENVVDHETNHIKNKFQAEEAKVEQSEAEEMVEVAFNHTEEAEVALIHTEEVNSNEDEPKVAQIKPEEVEPKVESFKTNEDNQKEDQECMVVTIKTEEAKLLEVIPTQSDHEAKPESQELQVSHTQIEEVEPKEVSSAKEDESSS